MSQQENSNNYQFLNRSPQHNLSKIDWLRCDKAGLSNMVKNVANLFVQGMNINDIAHTTNLSRGTIRRYLKNWTPRMLIRAQKVAYLQGDDLS